MNQCLQRSPASVSLLIYPDPTRSKATHSAGIRPRSQWPKHEEPVPQTSMEIPVETINLANRSVLRLATRIATRPFKSRLQFNQAGFKQILSQKPGEYFG